MIHEGPAAKLAVDAPGLARHAVPRVVVCEDDRDLRDLIADVLSARGFAVVPCGHGVELLECLGGEGDPDVLVTDVRMPHLGGLDALALLRAEGLPLPVVVMSAFLDPPSRDLARRLRADVVLEKPFDVDDLADHVVALARRRRGDAGARDHPAVDAP